eukprot:TRINITY_DN6834_c0_g2_i1.p1 TRINITY_DN6834_c0_g2~~TRINITY_DN6834_c0_g2_i1.p1  ORF type:complete len:345 (+),score=7.37 TRINITY_DN6834_c0_g2_i1:2-1036(+)
MYALDKGLKVPSKDRSKETNDLLKSILGRLEKDKAALQLTPEDSLHVEGFAQRVFVKADKQDRAGKADISTAKTFYAAGIFFDVLRQFGELPPECEQRQRYAVWKAADIRKALAEGRRPAPGPPGGDPNAPIPGSLPPSGSLPASAPPASSGSGSSGGDGGVSDSGLPAAPSAPVHLGARPGAGYGGIGGVGGGGGGPPRSPYEVLGLTPSPGGQPHRTTQAPTQPSHAATAAAAAASAAAAAASLSAPPPSTNGRPQASSTDAARAGASGPGSGSDNSSSGGASGGGAGGGGGSMGMGQLPPPGKVADAHKAARFAVSALAFDDVPTAVDYLKQALQILGAQR